MMTYIILIDQSTARPKWRLYELVVPFHSFQLSIQSMQIHTNIL